MERMNFGESFHLRVRLLHSHIFSCVLVNGYVSDAFKVTRGVRQGCPLFPVLYILVFSLITNPLKFFNMPKTLLFGLL